jgi:transcriptional regulator with XRE-family HTH domain
MDTLRELVAGELRATLARKRISAAELARRLGWSQSYMARRIDGRNALDMDDLEGIAEILEVTIADLLPRGHRVVTNGSSPTLTDLPVQPHPVDVRSGVVHGRKYRTGRTGKSLQRAISHSPAVA